MTAALLVSPWISWGIAGAATAGVIVWPFSWPDFVWAVGGAALLVALTGMMLLSELARQEGLFEWLAARAAALAKGSAARLFTLVVGVCTVVTVFLSNDTTAVVLTPAVAAVARAAKADKPLPYLFTYAFIANAASFVLPISNPANLVIYGSHMPPLLHWLPRYALPSLLSILATYAVLRWSQRADLRQGYRPLSTSPSCRLPAKWRPTASPRPQPCCWSRRASISSSGCPRSSRPWARRHWY